MFCLLSSLLLLVRHCPHFPYLKELSGRKPSLFAVLTITTQLVFIEVTFPYILDLFTNLVFFFSCGRNTADQMNCSESARAESARLSWEWFCYSDYRYSVPQNVFMGNTIIGLHLAFKYDSVVTDEEKSAHFSSLTHLLLYKCLHGPASDVSLHGRDGREGFLQDCLRWALIGHITPLIMKGEAQERVVARVVLMSHVVPPSLSHCSINLFSMMRYRK